MKAGLVLSGGGAKGAYQIGVESYLRLHQGFEWESLFGVSVGALNGAMLASESYSELYDFWMNISPKEVMSGNKFWGITKAFFGGDSIFNNEPLLKNIKRMVDPRKFKKEFTFGSVDLQSGRYKTRIVDARTEWTKEDVDLYHRELLASSTIPIIWKPIHVSDKYPSQVDGGLRNMTPIGSVLGSDIDCVVVILLNPIDLGITKKFNNLVDISKRTLEILTHEVFLNDLIKFETVNDAVKQAEEHGYEYKRSNGEPYKHVKSLIIHPSDSLGDSFKFTAENSKKLFIRGFEDAKKSFEQWERDNV